MMTRICFKRCAWFLKLHRVPGVEQIPPTAYQVFQMATVNGAYASWFGDRIGTFVKGGEKVYH